MPDESPKQSDAAGQQHGDAGQQHGDGVQGEVQGDNVQGDKIEQAPPKDGQRTPGPEGTEVK